VIWKLAVDTAQDAEEAVTELLSAACARSVTSYTDVDTEQTSVTVFFEKKPDWSASARDRIRTGLERIRAAGLDIGTARISLRKVPAEDWAESWKRHFKPITIGSALLIKPTWSKRRLRRGQSVVVLDPGLSFGTGQHPTTSFCLEQLVARRRSGTAQSLLDIGTGSGILAIAAARLGFEPIHAFDVDPDAVRTARANARQNAVARQIRFFRQDVKKMHRRVEQRYSIICANVLANVLVEERTRIVARLAPGGVLVLAGILKQEFGHIQRAYESCGLHLIAAKTEKDWRSASFMRH
jgi:ribosomal protein L11 methyltransferase